MTDDFEASLQVLRGFDTDISVEVNEIKVCLLPFIYNSRGRGHKNVFPAIILVDFLTVHKLDIISQFWIAEVRGLDNQKNSHPVCRSQSEAILAASDGA